MNSLLKIEDLNVTFNVDGKKISAVKNTNLVIYEGESFSIVGESGSGKSVTCLLYTSPSPRDVEESRMPSSA